MRRAGRRLRRRRRHGGAVRARPAWWRSATNSASSAPGGAKYTVNALEEDGTISCDTYPLWIQVVARDFGMRFETDPCLEADEVPRGRIFATPGAKVADVATQVDAFLATASPASVQLALMWAGGNDILELYAQYPAQTESALADQASARGRALAALANLVGLSGHPVVIVTCARHGAVADGACSAGTDAQRVMSCCRRNSTAPST